MSVVDTPLKLLLSTRFVHWVSLQVYNLTKSYDFSVLNWENLKSMFGNGPMVQVQVATFR